MALQAQTASKAVAEESPAPDLFENTGQLQQRPVVEGRPALLALARSQVGQSVKADTPFGACRPTPRVQRVVNMPATEAG